MNSVTLLCAFAATGGAAIGWYAAIYLFLSRAEDTHEEL